MGILANSASVTHASSTSDDSNAGYITSEQITLSTSPTQASYSWGLSKPSGATVRSALSSATNATPVFTPDVAGTYTLTEGTSGFILRITVTAAAIISISNAQRFSPIVDTAVPSPAQGLTLYCSSTVSDQFRVRDADGNARDLVAIDRVGANLTDADQTLLASEGVIRVLPAVTLTVNRIKTLGTAGDYNGAKITIVRNDSEAFTMAIVNGGPGAGTLFTFPVSQLWFADFQSDGTDWIRVRSGQNA